MSGKYISEAEAVQICGIARRSLYYMAQTKIRTQQAKQVSDNGRRPRLYCLDDLGAEAVQRYHEHLIAERASREERRPIVEAGTLIDPQSGEILREPVALTKAPEWALIEANWRNEIVQQALEIKTQYRGNATPLLKELAQRSDITLSTLYNYLSAFKLTGYQGLFPNWRRPSSIDPQIEGMIKYEWLQPSQILASEVHQRVVKFAAENELKAPSYSTVARVISSIDEATATFCRLGRKAWSNKYEPILRRDYSDLAVGEIICGDHRELDLFVSEGGRVFRPWVTAWIDLRSRKVTGYHIDVKPSSRTIAIAFRNSVLTHGRPRTVYMDNGKDYASHYLNGKVEKLGQANIPDRDLTGVFGYLKVGVIHAIPYSARSKPIERWFRNIPQRLERHLPGWCGSDNKQRPEKLLDEIKSGQLLSLDQLRKVFAEFVEDYNAREHSEISAAPNDLWKEAVREIPDARALDMCLMKHQEGKQIFNDGIHLFNFRYWAPELAGLMSQKVDIRYDTADVGRLYVFHKGEFICEAGTAALGSMKTGEAVMVQKAKDRKAARKRIENYQQDLRILHNPAAALEAAHEKVGLPAPDPRPKTQRAKEAGAVIPIVTQFDGMARQVDAEPAAPKQKKKSTWEKYVQSTEVQFGELQDQGTEEDRKQQKSDRRLKRSLGEDYQQIFGG